MKYPSPDKVRAARTRSGLTQSSAAALVHVSLRNWQQWEAGERRMHQAIWERFLSLIAPIGQATP